MGFDLRGQEVYVGQQCSYLFHFFHKLPMSTESKKFKILSSAVISIIGSFLNSGPQGVLEDNFPAISTGEVNTEESDVHFAKAQKKPEQIYNVKVDTWRST